MPTTNGQKLSVYEFGRRLLETNDLDPVYVVLYGGGLSEHTLHRWLLAYWCFYNAGTASKIADSSDFWWSLDSAARSQGNSVFPRGHERRHFRGQAAVNSVADLRERGLDPIFRTLRAQRTLPEVMSYVQTWKGFGPWIAFKVADMIERLGLAPIRFDGIEKYLFDSPREGAELLWKEETGLGPDPPTGLVAWALETVSAGVGGRLAPPGYDRPIGGQEAETILCKWKSYWGGHYEVGEDVRGLRAALLRFGRVETAQRLLRAGKCGGLWP